MAVTIRRAIDPAALAALDKPAGFCPATLVYLDWPTGALRAHSGVGPIVWGGETWHGVGPFGDIEVPGEAIGVPSGRAVLSLMGLADDALGKINGPVRNRAATILSAVVTEPAGNVLVGEPWIDFEGYVDAARFRMRRAAAARLVNVVQIDVGAGPSGRLGGAVHHSDADQSAQFPGDTAGRHLLNIEARTRQAARWPS